MDSDTEPREVYNRRLYDRKTKLAIKKRHHGLCANLRLIVFCAGVAVGILSLFFDLLSPLWFLVPLVGYLALVVVHDRVIQARDRAALSVEYYKRRLSRLDNTWAGSGIQSTDYVDENHPYAADMDLFGHGSLFELLCTARTRSGEETLACWLSSPASKEAIIARQQAVDDLRGRVDLREELALLGGGIRAAIQPQLLIRWGERPPVLSKAAASTIRAIAWLLTAAAASAAALWAAVDFGPLPLIGVGIAEWVLGRMVAKKIGRIIETIEQPERQLLVLTEVLARLENEPFKAPRLKELQKILTAHKHTASVAIKQLDRLVMWLDNRRNAFFVPIAFLTNWTIHFALAIESWRLRAGGNISAWLETIGEFEALCDLAGYAYEHPSDPFPQLVDKGPLFEAQDLGHPLLPREACVRNNVNLGGKTRAWIVSGSNMSGKSTLLRTIGVNTLLAQAGAPVRASSLRLSPLNIGATIRIHDSLQTGSSRFYAEITRLKQLMDLTEQNLPLLFMLDEILHGTNSHDRQIGATAVLQQLVKAGAIGLVTTHDLALADGAKDFDGQVENTHFDDQLVDGELSFDYKIKPGVVQGSNAIELMRSVGLQV